MSFHRLILQANHGACSHPGTQLGPQKKDFGICSSVAQANIVLTICLLLGQLYTSRQLTRRLRAQCLISKSNVRLYSVRPASYPDVSLSMKICSQRKKGRRKRALSLFFMVPNAFRQHSLACLWCFALASVRKRSA